MKVLPGQNEGPCVVILANPADRATALAALCRGPGRQVLATDDAYAAAVEILTADRRVLVVDVASLRPEQEGLLALAAALGIRPLGVGRGDRPGRRLEGLTIVEPAGLPEALGSLADDDATERPTESPPKPPAAKPPEQTPAPRPRLDGAEDLDLLTPQEIAALLEPPS